MRGKALIKFLIGLSRWYAWAFGSGLMVYLGVFMILPHLSADSQWLLIILLLLYLPCLLVTFWDDTMKLPKK